VTVKDSGGTTLKTYKYDGLNRRVTETVSGTTTDLYYSDQWQVLEKRVGSNTTERYVWSPVYVDSLVLRDRDTDANGTLDERLWVQQDANFNVTALVNGSGTVVERYAYDLYGAVTIYDASYTVRTSSSYGWNVLWQGMVYDSVSGSYKSRERTDISPTLGRPFQPDPIRFAAGDVNFYRWENNGPVSQLDPFGLDDYNPHARQWHHMYPQAVFKDLKTGVDIHASENGYMLFAKDHIGKGGIHPEGWNQDWAEWVEKQKAARKPINAETMKAQLEQMKASPKYSAAFKSGYPATMSYAKWGKHLEELAAKKIAKESAEKLGPKIVKKAAWVGKRVPGVGIGVAILFWPADVQAKGWVGGTANTLLDAIPFGGTVKGGVELGTGDLIPDKGQKSPLEDLIPSVYPFNTPQIPIPSRSDQLRGGYIDPRSKTLILPTPTLGMFRMQPSLPPRR